MSTTATTTTTTAASIAGGNDEHHHHNHHLWKSSSAKDDNNSIAGRDHRYHSQSSYDTFNGNVENQNSEHQRPRHLLGDTSTIVTSYDDDDDDDDDDINESHDDDDTLMMMMMMDCDDELQAADRLARCSSDDDMVRNDNDSHFSIYGHGTLNRQKKLQGQQGVKVAVAAIAVPSEVKVSLRTGQDNNDCVNSDDDDDSNGSQEEGNSDSEEESLTDVQANESEEEVDEDVEGANEDEDEESVVSDYDSEEDYDDDIEEPSNPHETDSDQESIMEDDDNDDDTSFSSRDSAPSLKSSSCSSSSSTSSCHSLRRQWKVQSFQQKQRQQQHHELFLPWGMSPSTESLKYDDDDDDESSKSSNEEEDDDRAYMMLGKNSSCYRSTNNASGSGRPRMWNGSCFSSTSLSLTSDVKMHSMNHRSRYSTKKNSNFDVNDNNSNNNNDNDISKPTKPHSRVTFCNSVSVYPIFETTHYPPSMVLNMYTKREELRVNKLRNKREFAHELYDWRNAIEEDEMKLNDSTGELIHPAHHNNRAAAGKKTTSVTSSSSLQQRSCSTTSMTTTTTHRNVVQTYSSAMGGYTIGGMTYGSSALVHHQHQQPRVKRMRMYYP